MSYLLQHQLMNSAKKYPDKDAVVFGDEKISYRDLDVTANKLAYVLIENGVKRGDRVGIYVNKSIASIISIHGILKAGAAYVPLDPSAPASRLAYIIDNCEIKCLLTSTAKANSSLADILAKGKSLQTAILTDDKNEIGQDLAINIITWTKVKNVGELTAPENQTIETDLAYILYTSGSTGTPKGVMITHLNSLTFVNWVHDTFELGPDDKFSNHAPLHFDLSILDIFVSMKSGGTLFPVPEGLSAFPIRLAEWIENNEISVWYSVPSILSMMVLNGQLQRNNYEKLRIIFFAGEVFPVKYLRELMNLIPYAEYYNLYGPTETNVITYYQPKHIPADQTKPIPIGKSCANMEVFALTTEGELVTSPGQEGELMGRGSCVAQGYWADEEKTKKSFVTNPRQSNFQEKMYKTGDIVTLDEEGNYLYVGRRDHMIKSRGYRIEIGDIESTIYTHENIKEAAVIAIPDELISNRIKCFVVLNGNKDITAADIRFFCSEKLPKYMVPETVEFRDSLPKTSTGKVDKPTLLKESLEAIG